MNCDPVFTAYRSTGPGANGDPAFSDRYLTAYYNVSVLTKNSQTWATSPEIASQEGIIAGNATFNSVDFQGFAVNATGAVFGYDSYGSPMLQQQATFRSLAPMHEIADFNDATQAVGDEYFFDNGTISKISDLLGQFQNEVRDIHAEKLSNPTNEGFPIIQFSAKYQTGPVTKENPDPKWEDGTFLVSRGTGGEVKLVRIVFHGGLPSTSPNVNGNFAGGTLHGKLAILLPVDIDFVHPATGEMNESREQSEGGYIAIRKDEETPVTKLKLHKLDGMPSAEFKLVFSSSKIKIWKDENRTQAVTSDQTTFPANADTELFLEGVEKSDSAKDVEIGLKVKIGSTESSAVTAEATVVQSEFKTTIQAFIPYLWIDVPFNWTPVAWDEVAIGDNRTYDPTLNQTYRARQTFIVTPFADLTTEKIKPDSNEGDAGLSIHYDKSDSVPQAEQGQAHGYNFVSNPVETRRGQGTVDIPTAGNVQPIDSKRFTFQAHMAAWEGVLGPMVSEPIVWNLTFGFDVRNPVLIRVLASGTRKGFPAYEIYISNSEDENLHIYQWTPAPERYIIPHLFITEPIAPDQPLELLVP